MVAAVAAQHRKHVAPEIEHPGRGASRFPNSNGAGIPAGMLILYCIDFRWALRCSDHRLMATIPAGIESGRFFCVDTQAAGFSGKVAVRIGIFRDFATTICHLVGKAVNPLHNERLAERKNGGHRGVFIWPRFAFLP